MITIKDIVELAKAGYKVNEVKELIELSKAEEIKETDTSVTSGSSTDGAAADIPTITPGESAAVPEEDKDDTDYKALYEASQIELKEAQKANIKRDISSSEDNKSDEEILKDLIKEFI